MMVKNLTAPLLSLNQEQLNRNRMEDDVTLDDLSLTWMLGGGTGGPTARTVGDLTGDHLRIFVLKVQIWISVPG